MKLETAALILTTNPTWLTLLACVLGIVIGVTIAATDLRNARAASRVA